MSKISYLSRAAAFAAILSFAAYPALAADTSQGSMSAPAATDSMHKDGKTDAKKGDAKPEAKAEHKTGDKHEQTAQKPVGGKDGTAKPDGLKQQ